MFAKLNINHKKTQECPQGLDLPCILIVEDDAAQMEMLNTLVHLECQHYFQEQFSINYKSQIVIAQAHSLSSLNKVLSLRKGVFQIILDCNMPDKKGEKAHDQFVKKDFRITGQHRAVDLVLSTSAVAELLLISANSRFQKTVPQFYSVNHNRKVLFAKKTEANRIQQIVRRSLGKQFPSAPKK